MKTPRKKRTQKDYSLAFKLQVVLEVEKGERTYKQAQKYYGIQGRSTVLAWLRKYGNLDWSLPKIRYLENKQPTPEQRIKQLETALQEEKDRSLVYKTMIEIVEKEYGLPVRKKFSTKQSKNSGKPKK
jgi:transposase